MTLSRWAEREVASGGWIRRMFLEGQRLRALHGDDAVADLALGQPLDPEPTVSEAFRKAAAETQHGRFAYMPNCGYPDVRQRVAEDVGVDGVDARCVALTCGAAGAICVALRAFVEPGLEVVGLAPYFPEFRLYAETSQHRFVSVPSRDDGGFDVDAIASALTPSTGAVLINTPNNPSGHVITDEEMRDLAEVLKTHNVQYKRKVLLVVDEVYRRLIYPPAKRIEPLDHYEHTVLARSFSKDIGIAGERVGYLVLHPSMVSADVERGIEMCMRALGFVNAPATAQRALLHLPTWEIDLAPYRERRDLMLAGLNAAGLEAASPHGGLYLWVKSPWDDTLQYIDALAKERTLFSPGIAFGVASHFRICFSVPLASIRLANATLKKLSKESRPA